MKTTKNSPYTNWLGAIMLIGALSLYIAQYFVELKQEVDNTVLAWVGGVGLLIWVGVSDQAAKIVLDWLKNKFGGSN